MDGMIPETIFQERQTGLPKLQETENFMPHTAKLRRWSAADQRTAHVGSDPKDP